MASGSVVASVSSDHIAKIDVTGLDSSTTDCPAANVRKPIDGLISIYARCTPLLRGLLECET
ncbi:hypothetical protein M2251_006348 [Rhodococcus erythropolis]|nr:hypothetical protein [Rhodococcus erythropolis]